MKSGKSTLGEIKGKIELLINEVLPRIEGKITSIEEGLNNHLKHHLKLEEKKSDRWFKIWMTYLLSKK